MFAFWIIEELGKGGQQGIKIRRLSWKFYTIY
jgi:hypothetical protein